MKVGKYKTKHGSIVIVSGEHGGKSRVDFDWLEEPNACCDCEPEVYPEDGYLIWSCDVCGGGSAILTKIE